MLPVKRGLTRLNEIVMLHRCSGDQQSYLGQFLAWLSREGLDFTAPDLAGYRDYLLAEHPNKMTGDVGVSRTTASAYLSAIRLAYGDLLEDVNFWQDVGDRLVPLREGMNENEIKLTYLARREKVREIQDRIRSGISVKRSRVRHHKVQDSVQRRWPSVQDVIDILRMAEEEPRDYAMIYVLAATGVRTSELIQLRTRDIFFMHDEMPGVLVRAEIAKLNKERFVPYGAMADKARSAVQRWLDNGGSAIPFAMTRQNVHHLLKLYGPFSGHDYRRFYARTCFQLGMSVRDIALNLGHSLTSEGIKTTERNYIGLLQQDVGREPPDLLSLT